MKSRLSSLRNRFLLALIALFLAAMCALGLIANFIIYPALLEEESALADIELNRVERVMESDRLSLLSMVKDWATWDDTYEFMQGHRETYVASNFSRIMFEDMDYQFMLFFKTDGSVQWTAGIDPISETYASCPGVEGACSWAAKMAKRLLPLVRYRPDEGMAYLEITPQPAFVALYPILRTDESGPPQGWLAQVRLLDEAWQAHVEDQTGLPVELLTATLEDLRQGLRLDRSNSDSMTITRPIRGVPGSESLLLQSHLPREDFFTKLATFRYTQLWTAGLLLTVIAIVLFLLESMVLRPLRQFAAFTQQLQQHGDASPPHALLKRRDEIGVLAREFDKLLEVQRRQTSSLVELSQHDPLTGLANRRLFDEYLANTLSQAALDQTTVSLLMVDIDHFKNYNDHYGHPAGDECLKTIAEAMRRHFSHPKQLVARTGGEEFTIVIPGTSCDASLQLAGSLRTAIESLNLPHPDSSVSRFVTVSIGMACSTPQQKLSPEALIAIADGALYRAKQSGRNRIDMEVQQIPA